MRQQLGQRYGCLSVPLLVPQVAGGRTMKLRTSDPIYTAHVDRWWATLFSKLRRFLYRAGGPIVMVQV